MTTASPKETSCWRSSTGRIYGCFCFVYLLLWVCHLILDATCYEHQCWGTEHPAKPLLVMGLQWFLTSVSSLIGTISTIIWHPIHPTPVTIAALNDQRHVWHQYLTIHIPEKLRSKLHTIYILVAKCYANPLVQLQCNMLLYISLSTVSGE